MNRTSNVQISKKIKFFLTSTKNYWFPILVLTMFGTLVINNIHGSSIGIYWYFVQSSDARDPALLFGIPRSIRSDEFRVSTPWALAQSQVGFSETNSLIGFGQNLVFTDAPILSWEAVFEPQNWSFFVLPLEYAFTFRWWFRGLLLLISAYLLFLQTFNGKWYLASLASISAFFMPIVQWYYSTCFVEAVAYFFLLVYLFHNMVYYRTIFSLSIWTLLFCYVSLCFVSLMYVPVLVPASIAIILLLVGIIFNKWSTDLDTIRSSYPLPSFLTKLKSVLASKQNKALFIALSIVLTFDILFLVSFYMDNQSVFEAIRHTSYPGARRSPGGTLSPELFFGAFLNIFLTKAEISPIPLGANQSGASSFFPFSIFILPVLLFLTLKSLVRRDNIDYFLLFLLLAYIILLTWSFLGLPGITYKLLLLQFSKPERTLLVLGALNQIMIYYYLAKIPNKISSDFVIFSIIYSIGIFIIYLYWTRNVTQINSDLLPNWKIGALLSSVIMVLMLLLLLRKTLSFWIFFTIFTLASTISVNPLYRGLDVILNSELSKALREIDSGDNTDALWVNYDDWIMSNYMVANGIRVLNATQFSPQNSLWAKFDPKGENIEIYNRYAHILISENESRVETKFILNYGDGFTLQIHPCNSIMMDLGVTYFIFRREVQYDCLQKIKVLELLNVDYYIYSYKRSSVP
jgi:hypothetical protein